MHLISSFKTQTHVADFVRFTRYWRLMVVCINIFETPKKKTTWNKSKVALQVGYSALWQCWTLQAKQPGSKLCKVMYRPRYCLWRCAGVLALARRHRALPHVKVAAGGQTATTEQPDLQGLSSKFLQGDEESLRKRKRYDFCLQKISQPIIFWKPVNGQCL